MMIDSSVQKCGTFVDKNLKQSLKQLFVDKNYQNCSCQLIHLRFFSGIVI